VAEDGLTIRYPAGFVHLPKVDAEFMQQLCAEQLITRRDRNGFAIREWQKMRERNEALDCYVYARAAAAASGLDRFEDRHWRELEKTTRTISTGDPSPNEPEPEATDSGGLSVSGARGGSERTRRLMRSRWLNVRMT
jgi:phage terminase large subunit GpA-like protein